MTLAAIDLTSEAAEWEVTADRVIYWIFVLDYVVRFSISRSKWLFVKDHVWDLLAIIPFDVLFRLFRFASLGEILRLARYLDLFSYAMRFTTRIRRFFNTNGFKYICIAALVIILLGAVGIIWRKAEPSQRHLVVLCHRHYSGLRGHPTRSPLPENSWPFS